MQLGVTDDLCSWDLKWYSMSSTLPVSTRVGCQLYKDYLSQNELEFWNRMKIALITVIWCVCELMQRPSLQWVLIEHMAPEMIASKFIKLILLKFN